MKLAINFYNEQITEAHKESFHNAIEHEKCEMSITLLDAQIKKLETKINNEDGVYEDAEVAAFEVELARLEKSRKNFADLSEATLEDYDFVISEMTVKNENHFGNDKDVVRTVLRVLASLNDSKLMKLAIVPAFKSPELYQALEAIHVNSVVNEDGNISMTKEVKEAYKNASSELESIIKNTFSLPFETPFTAKTRVKLTAEDKKLLHDCYIKGFTNKFEADEDGTVSFSTRKINKLVKEKKNKKTGEVTYDYSGLASTIASIVIKHYFA